MVGHKNENAREAMKNLLKKRVIHKRNLKESYGRQFMEIADRNGKIELKKNLTLYSAAGLERLGLKDEKENEAKFSAGKFYFEVNSSILFECIGPLQIIEIMQSANPAEYLHYQSKMLPYTTCKVRNKKTMRGNYET